jgi:hypothetical protein
VYRFVGSRTSRHRERQWADECAKRELASTNTQTYEDLLNPEALSVACMYSRNARPHTPSAVAVGYGRGLLEVMTFGLPSNDD